MNIFCDGRARVFVEAVIGVMSAIIGYGCLLASQLSLYKPLSTLILVLSFFIHHFPLVFSKCNSSVNDGSVFSKIEHYGS
jgi:hypothetical protein